MSKPSSTWECVDMSKNDPVFSLCMDMADRYEDVMDEVLQVTGPIVSRLTEINNVLHESYFCQVLCALQTYAYVTGFEVKNLFSTLKPISELQFLVGLDRTQLTVTLKLCFFSFSKYCYLFL